MKVVENRLFDDNENPVAYIASPNFKGKIKPLYLIIHYTAGGPAEGTINWLKNPKAKASAHLVIDRDGSITQMVDFDNRAWHAGESKWGEIIDLNSYSIGIELANYGPFNRRADGAWVSDYGNILSSDKIVEAVHKNRTVPCGWEIYPDAQIQAALAAATALEEAYGFVDILGHDDIAPTRKTDPGPLFPMNGFRSKVLGRA